MAPKKSSRPLPHNDISAFCHQMATILKSGISASEGISLLLEEAASTDERQILQSVYDAQQSCFSLAEALKEPGVFPDYMISMVAIGEEAGRLDDVMESLAAHYEREASISKSLKSSITYPLIMTGMVAVVITVLLVKILPVFNQVFIQLGSGLTGLSAALMKAGTVISHSAAGIIAALCIIILAVILGLTTNKGRSYLTSILYSFGPSSRILDDTSACRFAGALSLTMASGLPIERGLELVSDLFKGSRYECRISQCSKLVSEGLDFSEAARSCGIFSGVYGRMLMIGEKTGSIDHTLDQIAGLYQEDIDTRMNNILAALEPALVVLLSVIVGVVLLSVMLPLMGIMSGL